MVDSPSPPFSESSAECLWDLMRLIKSLRGEDGCPWDRQQTPATMVRYLTEEVFELADAIDSDDPHDVCEELGDVLFQILFIAHIYQEQGIFDVATVARRNRIKMIRRHPHVFGNDSVKDTEGIRQRWHEIKRLEKKRKPPESILDSVPRGLPALMRAYRISERAARLGFDWSNIDGVIDKVKEEWQELLSVLGSGDRSQTAAEFGDVMFTLVNLARFARIHPETSLAEAVLKFENRFRKLEKIVADSGREMEALSIEEMDQIWERVKVSEPPE